jgi:regulator of RNase E activity RraB
MPNPNTPIDEARFEQEWEQDRELLAQLAANGDVATVERTIDVSFIGTELALEKLAEAAEDLGFEFAQLVPDEDADEEGQWRLDLDIVQTIEPDVVRALTRTCLEIEATYSGVEYDGWGCMATDGANN